MFMQHNYRMRGYAGLRQSKCFGTLVKKSKVTSYFPCFLLFFLERNGSGSLEKNTIPSHVPSVPLHILIILFFFKKVLIFRLFSINKCGEFKSLTINYESSIKNDSFCKPNFIMKRAVFVRKR